MRADLAQAYSGTLSQGPHDHPVIPPNSGHDLGLKMITTKATEQDPKETEPHRWNPEKSGAGFRVLPL